MGFSNLEEGVMGKKKSYSIFKEIFPLLLSLTYFLLPSVSFAQITFEKTYGGSGADVGYSVQQTTDGGYIVTGFTRNNVYLVKTDSLGDTLWTRTYGGTSWEVGYSVQQTQDGGFIITGETTSFGAGFYDVYLVKTDSVGDILWARTYGGTDYDIGRSVQETQDLGYIVAGETNSFGVGLVDVYLIKVDSLGDTLWTRTYGGGREDAGRSVQQTQDGGFIVTGETNSFGMGLADVYLIKVDSLGDTLWTKTYGLLLNDIGYSVQQTTDGGYIIAGETFSFGSGSGDVYLVKTDTLGDTLWTRTYGGTDDDDGYSVQQTSDSGYIIAGHTKSFGAGSNDVYLIKTSVEGEVGVEEESSEFRISNNEFRLLQNQPNPFLNSTIIHYQLPTTNYVTLTVYDITGRLIETLVVESQEPGVYQLQWDGKNQASGIYFYRLTIKGLDALPAGRQESSPYISTKKMTLLH
jgi:hypothetical protein